MDKIILLWLHLASIGVACGVAGLTCLYFGNTTHTGIEKTLCVSIVAIGAAVGMLTGLGSMLRRSAKSECVALAISTVAAFILLILAL